MTDGGPFQRGYKEAIPGIDYQPYKAPRQYDRKERIENAVGDALAKAAPGNTRDPMEYADLFPNRPGERLLNEQRALRVAAYLGRLAPADRAVFESAVLKRAEAQRLRLERKRTPDLDGPGL